MNRAPIRVGVVTSHPIQYNAPLFRRLHAEHDLDVTALYSSRLGVEAGGRIAAFGQTVAWDVDLMSGYRHVFAWNPIAPHPERRGSLISPGIAARVLARRFDVVVSYGWAYPVNWLVAAAARASRTPLLLYSDTDVREHAR